MVGNLLAATESVWYHRDSNINLTVISDSLEEIALYTALHRVIVFLLLVVPESTDASVEELVQHQRNQFSSRAIDTNIKMGSLCMPVGIAPSVEEVVKMRIFVTRQSSLPNIDPSNPEDVDDYTLASNIVNAFSADETLMLIHCGLWGITDTNHVVSGVKSTPSVVINVVTNQEGTALETAMFFYSGHRKQLIRIPCHQNKLGGRIQLPRNRWIIPSSIQDKALVKYAECTHQRTVYWNRDSDVWFLTPLALIRIILHFCHITLQLALSTSVGKRILSHMHTHALYCTQTTLPRKFVQFHLRMLNVETTNECVRLTIHDMDTCPDKDAISQSLSGQGTVSWNRYHKDGGILVHMLFDTVYTNEQQSIKKKRCLDTLQKIRMAEEEDDSHTLATQHYRSLPPVTSLRWEVLMDTCLYRSWIIIYPDRCCL
jgi:hypothetical protein